eukprot:2740876-Prymnesium_polylepis.1
MVWARARRTPLAEGPSETLRGGKRSKTGRIVLYRGGERVASPPHGTIRTVLQQSTLRFQLVSAVRVTDPLKRGVSATC